MQKEKYDLYDFNFGVNFVSRLHDTESLGARVDKSQGVCHDARFVYYVILCSLSLLLMKE